MAQVVFQALHLANEQRTAYGLRYSDYERYRKHCANRTHRLRTQMKMTHGKGKEFKKLPQLQSESVKEGHLQLLLFEAERAWAYSQELSAESMKASTDKRASTLRHQSTARFRRSVNWATQLLSHSQSLHTAFPSRLSSAHLIEVSIYVLILNGRFLRSRDEFDDALVQLAVARSLLDELAGCALTSRDQALARLFSDEVGPEIRYCAHEMGRAKAYDVDAIVKDVGAKNRNALVDGCDKLLGELRKENEGKGSTEGRKNLKEVVWEGEPVPVRNPELVDVLLRVQDAEGRLTSNGEPGAGEKGKGKRGVAAYDAVLLALSDAEEMARRIAESQTTTSASTGTRDAHFLHAYIVYQLLSRRIQRDLLLASSILSSSSPSSSPSPSKNSVTGEPDPRIYPALVKLLDTAIQSLTQMRTLAIVDDAPDLAAAVDARLAHARARRCAFLARCYGYASASEGGGGGGRRYAEALKLVQHAGIHVREVHEALGLLGGAGEEDVIAAKFYTLRKEKEVKELEDTLLADALRYKREWFAYNGGRTDKDGGAKGYKKPDFYNIALNYVGLDNERLRVRAGREPAVSLGPGGGVGTGKGQGMGEKTKKLDEGREDKKGVGKEEVGKQDQQQTQARGGLGSLLGGWWGRS